MLEVRDLCVDYKRPGTKTLFRAVDGVNFDIGAGETLGLVGESGSGKTTVGNVILGLVKAASGTITFEGRDLLGLSERGRRELSGRLQVVFQDPYSSLNPSKRILWTLTEPLLVHTRLSGQERLRAACAMLERVGLTARDVEKFPGAFSGGQRQRIAIARALMTRPKLVVCDEPVSGLDLSTQAQVLNLLKDLQADMGLAMLFVSHDLGVVRYMASRIAVMYQGKLVEYGAAAEVYERPQHAYTRRLLAASPVLDPIAQRQAREARKRMRAAEPLAA